jgi:hypothetical protein
MTYFMTCDVWERRQSLPLYADLCKGTLDSHQSQCVSEVKTSWPAFLGYLSRYSLVWILVLDPKTLKGRVLRLKAVVVMASVGVGRLWGVGRRELEMTKSWQVLSVEVRLYRPRFFP